MTLTGNFGSWPNADLQTRLSISPLSGVKPVMKSGTSTIPSTLNGSRCLGADQKRDRRPSRSWQEIGAEAAKAHAANILASLEGAMILAKTLDDEKAFEAVATSLMRTIDE